MTLLARRVVLSLAVSTTACFFDDDLKHDTGVVPEPLDDGWEIDTPENVGLSRQDLDAIQRELLREDRYRGALSFLVVKDGRLVWEAYLRGRADQRRPAPVMSVTKSVTSLLVGVARDRGDVVSLDLTLAELFPDKMPGLDQRKRAITLDNLLTMRSGLDVDNNDFYSDMLADEPGDRLRYMLDKPLYAEPGTKYYYRDIDPQIVSDGLTRFAGMTELDFARETLFPALDIRDYFWEAWPDGITIGSLGLLLLPRDLAKLGQMALDGGVWKGERVVSDGWLSLSTAAHVPTEKRDPDGGIISYGYYWWVVPDVGFAALGAGGQIVLVVPARHMVLVQTAYPYASVGDDDLAPFLALVRALL